MYVYNMTSPRTGNAVANQFIIEAPQGLLFQSYKSLVALKVGGKVYLTKKWEHSKTTMKYTKEFLNTTASAKTIRERIESGQYKLVTESEMKWYAINEDKTQQ